MRYFAILATAVVAATAGYQAARWTATPAPAAASKPRTRLQSHSGTGAAATNALRIQNPVVWPVSEIVLLGSSVIPVPRSFIVTTRNSGSTQRAKSGKSGDAWLR